MPARPMTAERFWSRFTPEPNTGCLLWVGATSNDGYGSVSWGNRTRRVHRVAWELVNGPVPVGLQVLHRCDTPLCGLAQPNGQGHLFLGTNTDNVADMCAKGRQSSGVDLWSAKLTPELVHRIRALHRVGGITQRELASRFGVGKSNISYILCGITWREGARD